MNWYLLVVRLMERRRSSMKIPSTVKKVINEYIKGNKLDKKQFYEKLMPIYEKIMSEMDEYCDCGGKDNSMAVVNMSLAAGFFALYDVTDRKITVQESLELTDKVIPKSIPVITSFVGNHIAMVGKLLIKRYTKLKNLIEQHKAKGEWTDSWSIDMPFSYVIKYIL